jgi:hypothetical protein
VTFRAFAFLWPARKLTAVRIRFVTHRAWRERNLFFKIAAEVTCDATDRGMFSEQREFSLRVIEFEIRCKLLPTSGGVAMLTGFFELTVMRIEVTRIAGRKFHVFEARWPAWGIGLVAFFAGNGEVQTGERVTRLGVIELLGSFPIRGVMAARAILAQLPFVIVHMARHACLRQSQVGLAEIFILDQSTFSGCNVRRGVALLAVHAGVFAIQWIPGEFVVELFDRNIPVNQMKVNSVVLQMAVHAILALRILHLEAGVITMFFRKRPGDFLMAIEALESRGFASELVTGCALRGTRKALVGI